MNAKNNFNYYFNNNPGESNADNFNGKKFTQFVNELDKNEK
jgi:hypothetical protein